MNLSTKIILLTSSRSKISCKTHHKLFIWNDFYYIRVNSKLDNKQEDNFLSVQVSSFMF